MIDADDRPGCLAAIRRALGLDAAPQVAVRLPYRVRDDFLSPAERNLYGVLCAAMEDLLRPVKPWERRDGRVDTYSGGMKRQPALTRALLYDPEIILFDSSPSVALYGRSSHIHPETLGTCPSQNLTCRFQLQECGSLLSSVRKVFAGMAPDGDCSRLGKNRVHRKALGILPSS